MERRWGRGWGEKVKAVAREGTGRVWEDNLGKHRHMYTHACAFC